MKDEQLDPRDDHSAADASPDGPDTRPEPAESADDLSRLLPLAGVRPPIPVERALRVEAVVRARWRRRAALRRRVVLAVAATVAGLALGVGAWWSWSSGWAPAPADLAPMAFVERLDGSVERRGGGDPRPLVVGEGIEPGVVVVSGELGRVALRLGPATSLRLDRATEVRFLAEGRLELIAGALYLDSREATGAAAEPDVLVETRWGEVRKRGTQFEARVTGDGLRLRVREGSVVMNAGAEVHQVASGVELTVGDGGEPSRRAIAPHAREWGWAASIAPSFGLDGSTLGEFLAWVSRETGRAVRFADPELAASARALILGGAVEELSPEQALLAVLPTCGLEHRYVGDAVVLSSIGPQGPSPSPVDSNRSDRSDRSESSESSESSVSAESSHSADGIGGNGSLLEATPASRRRA